MRAKDRAVVGGESVSIQIQKHSLAESQGIEIEFRASLG